MVFLSSLHFQIKKKFPEEINDDSDNHRVFMDYFIILYEKNNIELFSV